MQFPIAAKPPVGIVFDAAMRRIDEVLALAMLHGFDGKGQARIAAVCVSSGDLRAAQYCDAVRLFYASATTGLAAMFMHSLPVGLADPVRTGDAPMFQTVGQNTIKSIDDTADPATLIRNTLMAQNDGNAAVVLSGPATDLAHALDMYGVRDWIARKVRVLSVAETGLEADRSAADKVISGWPTPIVTVSRAIGEALPFPGESITRDFAYATPHPIADAYRAFQPMPYDAPSWAMAAMLYAVDPNDGYFKLTGSGNVRALSLDPEQKDRVIRAYIEMASAKPVPRKPRHPVDDKDKKKDEKKDVNNKPDPGK